MQRIPAASGPARRSSGPSLHTPNVFCNALLSRTAGVSTLDRGTCRARRDLQPEQPLGVDAQDLGLVLVIQRHGLHPLHGRRIGHERPVDREADPVDAEFHHAAQQCRVGEVALVGM